ncbi:type III secretion exporter [Oceaniovalibus guishaninsula JLT2003]|uniref:Type III secretion exporter n=1 Tax=Oceaniovalibus guishaninsula JLT2003 TaxID=1231392 RepID=K2I4G4_9RHOB|nr:flagellar type III secretion system protein FlhB [Oceaniovalibus guishaninsula]EKE43770.1 type III secretion exporter [Oceaniovalibus guishaninsula JLT2003]
MSGGGEGAGEDDSEKPFDPSQKKLDDAREKGEVPRSADLVTTGAYAGLLLAGLAAGGPSLIAAGTALSGLLDRADTMQALLARGSILPLLAPLLGAVALALLPWAVLPPVLALLSAVAQRAFLVTGSKLEPKLSRINPIANAKQKFGRGGLFEFAKSATKLTIYSLVLFAFVWRTLPQAMAAIALSPELVTMLFLRMSIQFLMVVFAISLVIGGADFFWQRAEHLRKHRMSHKDMMDEHKQSEGDPHIKQQRRQRGYDIAMNTMLADVPQANVVIVNPTHYAIALKWDRAAPGAPTCVAKGVDLVAARIREAAQEAGVPLHSDPPTARALHAAVEIGQEIRPEHYAAVAVAIRFAEDMRKKAGRR